MRTARLLMTTAVVAFSVISPDAIAEVEVSDLDESKAIQMFRAVFGGVAYYSVLSMPPEGIESALSSMAMVFNIGVFVVLSYLMFFMMLGKLISSGNDGELMSSRYNDTMTVTRSMISFAGILPVVGGFCLAQVLVMFVAIQASFLADEVNKEANHWTFTNGSISTYRPDPLAVNTLILGMLRAEVCASAFNNYYNEHPRYARKYQIEFKQTQHVRSDDQVGFVYGYQNASGQPICGQVSYSMNDDVYFGNVGDPTGTFDKMSNYQLQIRNRIFTAQHAAVVKTHNYLATSLSSGIVTPGKEIDVDALEKSYKDAKAYYHSTLLSEYKASSASLEEAWAAEVDDRMQSNSLTFSAANGWVFNGFTWIEKGRLESFMSKLTKQIPAINNELPHQIEVAFQEERLARAFNVLTKLSANNLSTDTYMLSSSTPKASVEALENQSYYSVAQSLLTTRNDPTAYISRLSSLYLVQAINASMFNFDDYDPITNLQHLGYRMVNTGFSMLALGIGIEATLNAVEEVADANIVVKAADLFTGGVISGTKGFLSVVASHFVQGLMMLAGVLIAVGTLLAYWLPSLPFFMWVLAVLGNYLLVGIAFMAAPLFLAANSLPGGDGWSSDNARQGWITLITILARPSIMVMTWHVAILLMSEIGDFASSFLAYVPLMNSESMVVIWGGLASLCVFLVMEYVIANRCLSLIYEVPDQLPLYYGGQATAANESVGEQRGQGVIAGWSHQTQSGLDRSMAGGGQPSPKPRFGAGPSTGAPTNSDM